MVEAGVGAECDGVALGVGEADAGDGGGSDLAGAFVGAGLDGFGEGFPVAGDDGEPATFDGGFAQGDDAAAAIEAIGREDGLPDGVVVTQDLAVHGAVAAAGFAVEDGDVHPVRVSFGGLFHAGFATGHVGALQVGLVEGFEPSGAAELDGFGIALAVDDDLLAPPALGL